MFPITFIMFAKSILEYGVSTMKPQSCRSIVQRAFRLAHLAFLAVGSACLPMTSMADLPTGYFPLEYIEGTGTQWIDTDYLATPTTRTRIDFQLTAKTGTTPHILGVEKTASGGGLIYSLYQNGNGQWASAFKNDSGDWTTTGKATDTVRHLFDFNYANAGKRYLSIDNGTLYAAALKNSPTKTASYTLALGATSTATGMEKASMHRIYSCQMYEGDNLVRDFVPAVRMSDHAAGLYDMVGNLFYESAGANAYVAGPPIADYLLDISAVPSEYGNPTPSYAAETLLNGGDALQVSCPAAYTNAITPVIATCTGWKLYDHSGALLSSGPETSFIYTHPTPAAYRRLEWQWQVDRTFPHVGRTISIVETNRTGSAITSVRLAFSPTATETNTLFVAYGIADHGDDIGAWDKVDPLGVVPPETNSWTCAMPLGWGDTALNARFFLAKGVVLPYDYEVEYLESDAHQYVTLPKLTFTSLQTRFMKTDAHGRRTFLAGTGSYYWYDINVAGVFSGNGTCPINQVFDFAATNSEVWIDGVKRGSFVTQRDFTYNVHHGIDALSVGSTAGYTGNILQGRTYAIRMWLDALPVLEALPVMTNGVACFYDTISRRYIRNVCTGSYTPGPKTGYTRDQDERTLASSSATLGTGLSLLVASSLEEPTGMDPAPGSYDISVATTCTAPATSDVSGVRYTCRGYQLEIYQPGGWAVVGTNEATSYLFPADGSMRRVTWLWELTHYRLAISASPAANGAITTSPASDDGYFPVGTSVVLTPHSEEGKTHLGWYVVDHTSVAPTAQYTLTTAYREGPLTVTAIYPRTITGYFAGGWTYDASNTKDRRISNEVWNFTVTVSSSPAGLLLNKWNAGHGRLDFTTFEADTGLKVVGTSGQIFFGVYNRGPTSLYAPDLSVVSDRAFQYCYRLTDAILSPNLSSVGLCGFYEERSLTNFQPRVCPNLTSLGQMAFKSSSKITGDFILSGIRTFGSTESFAYTGITSVRLPACTTIANGTFSSCTKLTNVVTSATSIGSTAFSACSALKNVELTAKSTISIGASAFNALTSDTDIWYCPKNAASISKGCFYTGSKTAFPRLHVRHGNDAEAWKALCTRVKNPATGQTALTADDLARADYPGKRTIGLMYDTANERRIWVLADPLDSATILLMR